MNDNIVKAISALKELQSDATLPKNITSKIDNTIRFLESGGEVPIIVSKAISEIEDLTENNNMESFTRTQLFNVVSILEII